MFFVHSDLLSFIRSLIVFLAAFINFCFTSQKCVSSKQDPQDLLILARKTNKNKTRKASVHTFLVGKLFFVCHNSEKSIRNWIET